jgi:hypothetical protein
VVDDESLSQKGAGVTRKALTIAASRPATPHRWRTGTVYFAEKLL